MADVKVIIPVSCEHVLRVERAVKSALDNGVPPAHIKIFWDGDDAEKPRIEWLTNIYKDLHTFSHYGRFPDGVGAARNHLISISSHNDLILPLDADDYLLPGAVERMAAAWSPGKVVYGGWGEQLDFVTAGWITKQANPPEMLSRKHVSHSTFLFAKEDWQRVGGYDPDFSIGAEDWAFLIALANAGCELVRLDGKPLYVKTVNENGRTHKAIRHKDMIRQLLLEKYPDFMTRP